MTATLDELRELSRRSRRSQRAGLLAVIVALLLFPAQLALAPRMGATWSALLALAVGALPFVRYAYVAGQERGAFRRVFRRIADDARARTRTIVPDDAGADAQARAQEEGGAGRTRRPDARMPTNRLDR